MAEDETYGLLNAQSSQVTLKRLDLAFQHFFRRVRQARLAFRASSRMTAIPDYKQLLSGSCRGVVRVIMRRWKKQLARIGCKEGACFAAEIDQSRGLGSEEELAFGREVSRLPLAEAVLWLWRWVADEAVLRTL